MSIIDTLKSIPGKIKDFFTDIPGKLSQFWEDIKNIPTNVAQWFSDKKDAIVDWKDERVKSIKDTFNNIKDTITDPAKLKDKALDLWAEFKKEPVTNTLKTGLILSFVAMFIGPNAFLVMGVLTIGSTLGAAGYTEGKKVYDKWQGKKQETPEEKAMKELLEEGRGRAKHRDDGHKNRPVSQVRDQNDLKEQGKHAKEEVERRQKERGRSI